MHMIFLSRYSLRLKKRWKLRLLLLLSKWRRQQLLIQLADDVFLMGRSNVSRSITKAGTYSSVLSVEEAGTWRKLSARFKRLDEMARKLRAIEKQLDSAKDGES